MIRTLREARRRYRRRCRGYLGCLLCVHQPRTFGPAHVRRSRRCPDRLGGGIPVGVPRPVPVGGVRGAPRRLRRAQVRGVLDARLRFWTCDLRAVLPFPAAPRPHDPRFRRRLSRASVLRPRLRPRARFSDRLRVPSPGSPVCLARRHRSPGVWPRCGISNVKSLCYAAPVAESGGLYVRSTRIAPRLGLPGFSAAHRGVRAHDSAEARL